MAFDKKRNKKNNKHNVWHRMRKRFEPSDVGVEAH